MIGFINNSLRLTAPLTIILFVNLMFGSTDIAYAQDTSWTIQSLPFTNGYLDDLCLTDGNTGWAVGFDDNVEQAVIVHTTNGGDEWTLQPNPLGGMLRSLFFVNRNTGYAGGQDWEWGQAALLTTTNGGQLWQKQTLPILGVLEDMLFVDTIEGWAVGLEWVEDDWKTLIVHTEDGITWEKSNHPLHIGWLNAVSFPDSDHGWAVGVDDSSKAPIILHTSDGGENWTDQAHSITTGALLDVSFYNAHTGWAVGISDETALILKTTNGGGIWTTLTPPHVPCNMGISSKGNLNTIPANTSPFLKITNVLPLALTVIFIVIILLLQDKSTPLFLNTDPTQEASSALYMTTDGGNTWIEAVSPLDDAWIGNMTFVPQNTVQAVGIYESGPMAAMTHVTFPLSRIDVSPAEVTLQFGEQQQFQAQGYDVLENEISISPIWNTTGGAITQQGLYTATEAGDFRVTASVEGSVVKGTATVHVNPPELALIEIIPDEVTLQVGQQQLFTVTGYDAQANEIPITPIWSTTGGTINQDGLYTATVVGDFTVTASVSGSAVTGTAIVHAESIPPGDVNCDGNITPGDALCCFWRAILGRFQEECLCEDSEQAADVNCDGQITPGDALCIFWKSITGEWPEECVCEP